MNKVLVIGLDGATLDLIKPWVTEGKLPTFKKLLDEGIHGELISTIPPYTIPAWNSLATGKNPGKLGVYTFMCREDGGYEFNFSPFESERNIWKILSDDGKKVIVVNVPNVHFAHEINGRMIVGWLYRGDREVSYPANLKKKLDEVTGGYEIDVMDVDMSKEATIESIERNRKKYTDSLREGEYVKRVFEVMRKRFKAIDFLLKEEEWDFAFIVFETPDRIQHRFWGAKRTMLECYRKLDTILKRLLMRTDEKTTLIVLSDYGFGPKRRILNVNEWLLKEGYLTLKTANISRWIKIENFLRKIRMLSFAEFLMTLLPPKISQSLRERVKPLRVDSTNIDWTKTKVFTPPFQYATGDLYFNVKQREASGIINPREYEKLRDEIIQKLKNLRDPLTGDKISARVYKREEIYKGEYLEKAPDLVIEVNDDIQTFNTTIGHNQIFIEGKGGEHRINGIFLAYGPDIKKGVETPDVKIYDVAPTILHIFGLPIPEDMDGKVLKEIFKPESELAQREIQSCTSAIKREKKRKPLRQQEEEKIKKRLQRLGYI